MKNTLNIALAQMSPVWLDKKRTLEKVQSFIIDAAKQKADLVVFGEALVPGYPFWLSLTDGAAFNSPKQKEIHAHYIKHAVRIEDGDLEGVCALPKTHHIAIYLGIIECPKDRGGHSLYCSLVYIDKSGEIKSIHRKLQPTYEERLTWSPGDGHGLQVHELGAFTVGGLNCWENWMPLVRSSLYGMGENLHIAVWPGMKRNTDDITQFIAKEARSYVVSVSGLMKKQDFPANTPHLDLILENAPKVLADGGSCIAGPDGKWLIEPIVNKECVLMATIEIEKVWQERQNLDVSGHYSRPDVTRLTVNRKRQGVVRIED